jgi:hypothetical protein
MNYFSLFVAIFSAWKQKPAFGVPFQLLAVGFTYYVFVFFFSYSSVWRDPVDC